MNNSLFFCVNLLACPKLHVLRERRQTGSFFVISQNYDFSFLISVCFIIGISLMAGCKTENNKLFKKLTPDQTGIHFRNDLAISDTVNAVSFEYIYNGSGLAVADFNLDGLNDLYFGGNMVSSRLYLNLGDMKFRDVTGISGAETKQWCTGVSVVDINNDGFPDIYICIAGPGTPDQRRNLFFINQGNDSDGIPHFLEKAHDMGLDDNGYSTMGVFLDYDKDRDLDLYILTNSMEGSGRNLIRKIKTNGEAESTDRLYRNNGNGTFTNVSREAGILIEGLGLGINVCDINQDGWPDIYCSDDFISNDLLWINNRDGTFTESAGEYFKHFTYSGMGMDIADYNNDALPDVFVLDMMPVTNLRQKLMVGYRNLDKFYASLDSGYHPQFMRNTMQLNLGRFPDGKYRFSEIGCLAGIYQTDWSWAPLVVDFDNDGWKDLLITNGFRKDVTNLDFIFTSMTGISPFGTEESKKEMEIKAMNDLPDVKLPNYIFRNNRDLTFTDVSSDWGINEPTFTNGTAFADLDNDGDLDIVLNNIDQDAMIFENTLITKDRSIESHFLSVRFDTTVKDIDRLGLKLWIYHTGNHQFFEYTPYRGYKSTVEQGIHAGLGNSTIIDSLIFQWMDGMVSKKFNLPADTFLKITKDGAVLKSDSSYIGQFKTADISSGFVDITSKLSIEHKHVETSPPELNNTYTLLHNLSQQGPSIAVGDINGDGLDDFFTGSDPGQPAALFIQKADNTFSGKKFEKEKPYEDMGSLLFDADGDGDPDLYVVSGGTSEAVTSDIYQDRLYVNDGKGNFVQEYSALPEIRSSGSCVTGCDFDLDGDLDLFVGGRIFPGKYPSSPKSYLLENTGGKFTDKSIALDNTGGFIGVVNSALWTDINLDGLPDLIVVGEWMPVRIFINNRKGFSDQSESYGTSGKHGWWNSISGADLDNDGDIDYIVGNAGLNSFFKASPGQPVEIHARDFDNNGTFDPLVTHYIGGESFIVHPRGLISAQIPAMKNRFRTYEQYGTTPFDESFLPEETGGALHLKCTEMQSMILENQEGRKLKSHALPLTAQFSPVYGIIIRDFNNDYLQDILLTGNSYADETVTGYYDASYGTMLINLGNFSWKYLPPNHINLVADGDKKAAAILTAGIDEIILFSGNNVYIQALKWFAPGIHPEYTGLLPDDWYMLTKLPDGTTRKTEFYYGCGYLSQSSRNILITHPGGDVKIVNYKGNTRQFIKK